MQRSINTTYNMTTHMLYALDVPEGMLWGDCFDNSSIDMNDAVSEASEASSGWEEVGKIAPKVEQAHARPPKWCKHGNACLWKNCPFRHERCTIYDKWIANSKRGYSCRCMKADPDSCKSPEEGGCKYDHRDVSKLQTYYNTLPCETEEELWMSFESRGIISYAADAYGVENMSRVDRSLLVRSLMHYGVDFEDNETWMKIDVA